MTKQKETVKALTDAEIDALLGLDKEKIEKTMLKRRKNNLLLTDEERQSLLENYSINADECGSTSELLALIDQALRKVGDDENYSELSYIAERLDERRYYEEENK